MLLRDGSQEPIDDLEYDYLVHLAHDFELIYEGESQKREERHIAQTLQIGMRNSLGDVPGIATDSVYLSATNSALVGGDFYTLVRLPDDCAVMILRYALTRDREQKVAKALLAKKSTRAITCFDCSIGIHK